MAAYVERSAVRVYRPSKGTPSAVRHDAEHQEAMAGGRGADQKGRLAAVLHRRLSVLLSNSEVHQYGFPAAGQSRLSYGPHGRSAQSSAAKASADGTVAGSALVSRA